MLTEDKKKTVIRRLDLKVGYSCTNDCLFCVVADKRRFGDKTTDEVKDELSRSFAEGKDMVVFTGGECTMREDIFELVSFAKMMGYKRIQIQTNGRKFSSARFTKKMIVSGMTEFAPAIHGSSPEMHDKLTRVKGSWRQTVLGINNVKKFGLKILTNTVVTKQNYRSLPDIALLLRNLKVDSFQFAFIHVMGNAYRYREKIVPRMTDVIPYVKKGFDAGINSGIRVMAEAIPFCMLKGYEKYVSELYLKPIQVRDMGWKIDDFEKVRKEEAKKKFKSCGRCVYFQRCEGTWREYPELFGEKEFKAVCR